ncbi:SDR family oxidoreductase [Ktedonospora formicarum]|uniref:Short-chain dehydrogenase n=1 Tax=Ktedonospora formicarum TaxID=2778364 RepID=A0A8J3I8C5_9CHLR|nr:SDR family oxidoreductase [Ktedonospora formicarum]GHO46554.1 short-chain dehydrogenase [Ktedonospora formicarum]
MEIKDSIVLVTGGNRGLGKALVEAFLAAGARKVYVGSRTPIESADPRLHPIKLDITNEQEVAAAAQACQDVTILVNNAGVASFASYAGASSLHGARQEMETNYFGPLAMAQAFAPILKKNGGGALVNMLSVLSWFTSPSLGSYSGSKYAALSLTEGIRVELRAQGTRVIGAFAGYIDTDMTTKINAPKASPVDVAANIIEGIRNDSEEVLSDQSSHRVRAALDGSRKAFYQNIQQEWDNAQH